jgi:hypothetical protein
VLPLLLLLILGILPLLLLLASFLGCRGSRRLCCGGCLCCLPLKQKLLIALLPLFCLGGSSCCLHALLVLLLLLPLLCRCGPSRGGGAAIGRPAIAAAAAAVGGGGVGCTACPTALALAGLPLAPLRGLLLLPLPLFLLLFLCQPASRLCLSSGLLLGGTLPLLLLGGACGALCICVLLSSQQLRSQALGLHRRRLLLLLPLLRHCLLGMAEHL